MGSWCNPYFSPLRRPFNSAVQLRKDCEKVVSFFRCGGFPLWLTKSDDAASKQCFENDGGHYQQKSGTPQLTGRVQLSAVGTANIMRWLKRNLFEVAGIPSSKQRWEWEIHCFYMIGQKKTTTFAGGVILRIAKPQWNRQFVLELPQWLFLGGDMLPHLSFTKRTWEKKCRRASPMWHMWISKKTWVSYLAVCQNLVPLVNIKIAGKWMFIPLKMILVGIDPYLSYLYSVSLQRSFNLLQAALKRFFERAGNVRRRGTKWGWSSDEDEENVQRKIDFNGINDGIWMVVWNIWIIFPYIGRNHPNWRSHIFQGGRYTTNRWYMEGYHCHDYLLVMSNIDIAIENEPVETIDLPINSMVYLSSSLCKRLPEGITYYNYN